MTSAPTPVADLLERADDLSTLAETVEAVAETGRGRLVLVSGEAGVGKTALLRRFCSEQDARVLWGDCDPLFTPRPLGPLFAVAEEAGGAFQDIVARGVLPHEVACSAAPTNDHALDARIPHVVPARPSAADVVRLVRRWPAERRGTRLCVVEGRPETLECRCSPLGVLHHPPVAESVENLDSSAGAFGSSSL